MPLLVRLRVGLIHAVYTPNLSRSFFPALCENLAGGSKQKSFAEMLNTFMTTLSSVLADLPTVDALIHPDSTNDRFEGVWVLSEDGEALFVRTGEALTDCVKRVQDGSRVVSAAITASWITKAERDGELQSFVR